MGFLLAVSIFFLIFELCSAKPTKTQGSYSLITESTTEHFEQQFRKVIECLKGHLSEGDPEAGIPSFDPLRVTKKFPVVLDQEYLILDVVLENLVVDGLMDFEVVSLTLSPTFELEATFVFKRVHISSLYSGSANVLGMINVYGEGKMDMEFANVETTRTIQYGTTPPLIESYATSFHVGEGFVKFTGLFGDEDLSEYLSGIASEIIIPVINAKAEAISNTISPKIMEYVNNRIGHMTFLEFLAIISTVSCETKLWDVLPLLPPL